MSRIIRVEEYMDTYVEDGRSWIKAVGLAIGIICVVLGGIGAAAEQVPVLTNLPVTLTSDVVPGSTEVEIPFGVDNVDGIVLEVIVPVDGSNFSLVDPTGLVVLASGDDEVEFTLGADLAPEKSLPGGVYATEEIVDPGDGTWKIRIEFPPATEKTVVVATVFVRTAYQAGIAVARESYLVGEEATIGMLVLERGQPVLGLSPTISVTLIGSGGAVDSKSGIDDGIDPDGLADDGVYSRVYTFPQAGEYLIEGEVNIPTPQGKITRKAQRTIMVTEPPLSIESVTTNPVFGPAGCIGGIEEIIDLNVVIGGEYVVRGDLQSTSGKYITDRRRAMFVPGEGTVTLFYSGEDILDKLGEDGPFSLSSLDVLSISDEGFNLATRTVDVGVTPAIAIDSLCKDPIEIGTGLAVNTVLQNGYIESLEFVVPVTVRTAGNYQLSFKVIGAAGEDIDLVALTQFLTVGLNDVKFSIGADRFQVADGPYRVISALVLGGGNTAQQAFVGETPPFQRWQFLPTREGDLDADGDVDVYDRNIVLGARNTRALSPGDRRDIVRDGRIDLRDARAILRLR